MEQRYATTKAILKQKLSEKSNIALTSNFYQLDTKFHRSDSAFP